MSGVWQDAMEERKQLVMSHRLQISQVFGAYFASAPGWHIMGLHYHADKVNWRGALAE